MNTAQEDKSMPYVVAIIAAVVIGLVGVYIRFADFKHSSEVGDAIMFIASVIVFRAVFNWMKQPAA